MNVGVTITDYFRTRVFKKAEPLRSGGRSTTQFHDFQAFDVEKLRRDFELRSCIEKIQLHLLDFFLRGLFDPFVYIAFYSGARIDIFAAILTGTKLEDVIKNIIWETDVKTASDTTRETMLRLKLSLHYLLWWTLKL
ncbi:hypothetical protein Q3G72_004790 [Acer saccharum]|nr:hypothetical protein Q3G72_004790 [Acer saccharum]